MKKIHNSNSLVKKVYKFWNNKSCGEDIFLKKKDLSGYKFQSDERYRLEPAIIKFANFPISKGKKVLEIGVGLGAEHQLFAEAGANLFGIDLTKRAIFLTRKRLNLYKLSSKLSVGNAEALDFPNSNFDIVYSWGVMHHTPNTSKAINEVHRVLKANGIAKIMIYNKWSLVGIILWLRFALFSLRPWRSFKYLYAKHLESPGTKAYSLSETRKLFKKFKKIKIKIELSPGDLLEYNVGKRYSGFLLTLIKIIWPRWFIRIFLKNLGSTILIEAKK